MYLLRPSCYSPAASFCPGFHVADVSYSFHEHKDGIFSLWTEEFILNI
jgi:hypothetical protein